MRIYKELLSIELFSLKKLQNKSCIRKKKKWKEREKWRSGEGMEKNRWIYVVIFKELLSIKGMGGRVTLIGLRLFRKYDFIWCDRYGVWWWRIPQDERKIGRISYSISIPFLSGWPLLPHVSQCPLLLEFPLRLFYPLYFMSTTKGPISRQG